MKKLLFAIAAIAVVCFVSCKTETTTTDNQGADSAAFTIEQFTEAIPTLQDSAAVADLMAKANDQVQKFLAAGDTTAVVDFVGKIKEVIEANKDKLAAIIPTITEFAGNAITLPDDVKTKIDATLGDMAKEAVDGVVDAAAEKVDAAKDAVSEGVDKVADKAAEGVDKAKEEAAKAADKAAEALRK